MKRMSDRESPSVSKKTKFDLELGSSKLILPTRSSQEKKSRVITSLTRPQVDTEPIVLSSDDEDEILLHKAMLAKSLNVSPPNLLQDQKTDTPPVKTTTANDLTGRVKDKGKGKQLVLMSKKLAKASYSPEDVASAMDISNLDEDTDDEEDVDVEGDYEEVKSIADVNHSGNESVDLKACEEIPVKLSLHTVDDMSEVDELQSDTDADETSILPVVEETVEKVEAQPMSDVETSTTKQVNGVDFDGDQMSFAKDRPVRAGRNIVNTYNDIANSIDPEKLNYVSSDSDATTKEVIPVTTKKTRSSPPKTMRAAVILSKFTKELTSRRHLKTGFVYDTAMSYHATPNPMEIHPEDPRRIFKIFNILEQNGLLQECKRIKSRRATKEEILLVHNIIHYRKLRETADLKCRSDYMAMENDFDSIYLNSNSFESGLYAVGSLINLMEAVILNQVKNAFAIIRPPGHHAESDMPMGFCLFNNVAIATRDSMKRLSVKKTLIVDWDVHFGNGTQVIFSEDPNVLYVSLHRFEDGAFYPSDSKGSAEYTGYGKGEGRTLNIPWPCAGMTDADYVYAFRQVIMPIAMEFGPDVVVVSAGFDAAINDPIGKCNVTPAGYGQMTHMLKSIAHGKLVIALEGGYDLNSIAVSALACMNVLLGDAPEPIDSNLIPKQECIDTITKVKAVQKKYWNCLS